MSYKYDWTENNVIVTFEGDVKYEDIFHVDGKIIGDSRFNLMIYTIYDFSKVDNFKITKGDIKIFSALNISASIWNKRLKFACIVQNKNIKDTVSIYIDLMKESSWKIKMFNTLEKAIEWIEN